MPRYDDAYVLECLQDMEEWRVPESRWRQISLALDRLSDALASGEAQALRSAVDDIEYYGAVRARNELGPKCVDADDSTKELRAALVVELSLRTQSSTTGGPAAADGSAQRPAPPRPA